MYGFYEDIRLNELISIIIPVYNVENYIVDTCESVFAQTYRNWELLLVEDGSRDSSAEVIENPQTAAEPITLGEEEYFVLGDNRNHSQDSRDPSVGVLKKEDLIGRAWVRIYPFDEMGVIRHE